MENNIKGSGLQHILEKHSKEYGTYEPQQLLELAEASTSIGLRLGASGKGATARPIFGLFFYGKPVGVAIQVADNGFIVSMNPYEISRAIKKNPNFASEEEVVEVLKKFHCWPVV